MDDLTIENWPIERFRKNPRNARTHPDTELAQLMGSITEFGFTNPLLVDEGGMLIAGHARLEAAKRLGLTRLPCIVLRHLTPAQKRALMLADNKIALNAGWDLEILKVELLELSAPELELDLSSIGFETPELDQILGEPDHPNKRDPADVVEAIDRSVPAVSQPGDLWLLGGHRLLCGSSLEPDSFAKLLDGERADQVVTDPPYNVPIDGHVSGLGRVKHAEFAEASGEMTEDEFIKFLVVALTLITQNCRDGAIVMSFMDWRHCGHILSAARAAGLTLKNICVWDKLNGGMGSLYRSRHEFVFVFKWGTASHVNNVELGKHGRNRSNIWPYAGATMFRRGRTTDLETHPTVKPIAMIMDAIKDCSKRGGIILDPFGGSGTTLLAAERTGRTARLIELDPYYVDATIRRFAALTGTTAIHAVTGETFAARAASRVTAEAV
jgi:DNA modification methylase